MENLPDTAIDDIVSRLPSKTAAQTTALARSWRHRWLSVPNLDLSDSPLHPSHVFRILDLRHLHRPQAGLCLFKADAGCDKGFGECEPSTAVRLISALSASSSSTLRVLELSHFPFPSSFHLSSLSLYFPNLRHLSLSSSRLFINRNPNPALPFHSLHTLHVEEIDSVYKTMDPFSIQSNYRLSALLPPHCPSLETLTVDFCINILCCDLFTDPASQSNFPRLLHLRLDNCNLEIPGTPSSSKLLALTTLHVQSGNISGRVDTIFSACPNLEELILDYVGVAQDAQHVEIVAPSLRRFRMVADLCLNKLTL